MKLESLSGWEGGMPPLTLVNHKIRVFSQSLKVFPPTTLFFFASTR
jgi:hypothetical protein